MEEAKRAYDDSLQLLTAINGFQVPVMSSHDGRVKEFGEKVGGWMRKWGLMGR